MHLLLRFRDIHRSDDLVAYAERKIMHAVDKFDFEPINAEVNFEKVKSEHLARCNLRGRVNSSVAVSEFSVMASVDAIADKVEEIMRREKEKRQSQKRQTKQTKRQISFTQPNREDDEAADMDNVIEIYRPSGTLEGEE